jgi:hypothetical protein
MNWVICMAPFLELYLALRGTMEPSGQHHIVRTTY